MKFIDRSRINGDPIYEIENKIYTINYLGVLNEIEELPKRFLEFHENAIYF